MAKKLSQRQKPVENEATAFNEILARLPDTSREQRIELIKVLFAAEGEQLYTAADLKAMIDKAVRVAMERQQQAPGTVNGVARLERN